MKITSKAIMPNGTHIQLEDWSENYKAITGTTLAAYPIAKRSVKSYFMPKEGEKFRASFYFKDKKEAREAFSALEQGTSKLSDYIKNLNNPDYAIALED